MKPLFEAYHPSELVQTYRIINTPSDFARKSLFYVQETGYLKNLKSHLSERSNLSSYLFMIVLSGTGTLNYKEQSYSLKPSDCILINCLNHYTHQSCITSPWELLWVHFNGLSAGSYYQYISQSNDVVFHPDSPDDYIQIIHELLDVHQSKPRLWEFTASKLITDLLTNCIKLNTNSNTASISIKEKMYALRTYIDQQYEEKIQLDNLASIFYISKYHLSREFKRIFGITIVQYLTVKRINFAKELLRFTTQSIEEIAATSGYPDASYFNKVFRKTEGITASEYRNKWRGQLFITN